MISLAAGTVLDAGPAQTLRAAAGAGYAAAGLRLDPAVTTVAEATALRRLADDLGLALLDLEVVRLRPDRTLDDHRRLLELAVVLGARFLLAVSELDDRAETTAELAELTAAARGSGTRVVLEFMRFTQVTSLREALSVAASIGDADDGPAVLVDALHLHRGGETAADLDAAPAGRIGYLQLCDGPATAPADLADLADEARHHRLAPGTGELPLRDLLAHAPAGLPLSVEVQSDRLAAAHDPAERARLLLADTRRVLAATTWQE